MKIHTLSPIGHVSSPYLEKAGTPVQPKFGEQRKAEIHIFQEYREGLEDLENFSRIWIISWLDRSDSYKLKVIPFRDTVKRGLFATRAPCRPNPIGISPVELVSTDIGKGVLTVRGVDLLNGTPILDIKPYSPKLDCYPDEASGWLEKDSSIQIADNRFNKKN